MKATPSLFVQQEYRPKKGGKREKESFVLCSKKNLERKEGKEKKEKERKKKKKWKNERKN